MAPKVTIFTQAYNTEKYIEQCLSSVLSQTFSDFEYIIVDNGSTDKTKEIIAEYAKIDIRIKVTRFEENRTGFWPEFVKQNAQGEYFVSLDSDDWFEPTFLEVLLNMAEKEDLDVVACGSCFHYLETNKISYRQSEFEAIISKNSIPIYFSLMYQFLRTVWGKLYKMSIIKNTDFNGFYNISKTGYGGDTAFCLDSLILTNKIGISDKVLHHYLVRPKSTSYKYNPKRFQSDLFLYQKAKRYLAQFGEISKKNYNFLLAVYINAIIDTINVIVGAKLGLDEKLYEIEKILKEPLTQQGFEMFHNDKRLQIFKQSALMLCVEAGKANSKNEETLDLVYSNICLLNSNIHQYVSKKEIPNHLENSGFLFAVINLNNRDEILKQAISILDHQILSNSIWEVIKGLFCKNILLAWIDNQGFVKHYPDIAIQIYNLQLSDAMDNIYQAITAEDKILFEEELLFSYLNVAALAENASVFVVAKKLQTQYFIKEKRFTEAAASLTDLHEMCPNDEEVLELKKWLEDENEP